MAELPYQQYDDLHLIPRPSDDETRYQADDVESDGVRRDPLWFRLQWHRGGHRCRP